MKIMMISSGYYPYSCGGVETLVRSLSEGLKKTHSIVVLYSINGEDETEEYFVNGIKVIKMRTICLHNDNVINKKINRLLQMYNVFNEKIVRQLINNEKPDIVHIHMPRIISYSIFHVLSKMNIPVVVTLHECYSLWNYNPFISMDYMLSSSPTFLTNIFRLLQRKSINKVSYVVSPSMDIIKMYQKEKYYNFCPVKVIKNALPYNKKEQSDIIRCRINRLEKSYVRKYFYIGRLIQFKGLELILEAFNKWDKDNVELHIAGDGPLLDIVKYYANKDSRIYYHGRVEGKNKDELFQEMDVILFDVNNIEAFGLVCLEALFYGLPIIGSNATAVKRIVKDRITGYIIKNQDIFTIQEALEWYYDYSKWKEQVLNCEKEYKKYDYDYFIQEHLTLYNKIINEYNNN